MQDSISFEEILHKLKTQKTKIAISIATIVLAVGVYVFIMPQTFLSTSTMMPPEQSSGGGLSTFLQNVGGMIDIGGGQSDNKSKLMKSILASRSVAEKVNKKLDLENHIFFKKVSKSELLKLIPTMIDTEIEKSGVIYVNGYVSTGYFSSEKEQTAAALLSSDITNAAIASLNEILVEKSNSSAKNSRIYIETEIAKYKSELDSVSMELEKFQTENKILALEEQTQAIVTQAIELNTELNIKKNKLNLARIQYAANSEQVLTLQKEVDFLKQQSLELQRGDTGDEFAIPLSKVPALTRQYLELFRDKKIVTSVISYLETQKHQEAIQEEKAIPIVEVLDSAITPEKRFAPKRGTILVVTTFVAAIVVFIIFFFIAYNEKRKEFNLEMKNL